MIDTGASKSIVSNRFFTKFSKGITSSLDLTPVKLATVTGETLTSRGQVELPIDKIGLQTFVVISEPLAHDVILGQDFCTKFSVNLNFRTRTMKTNGKEYPFRVIAVRRPTISIDHIEEMHDFPSWMNNLRSHPVFREEIGHCLVSKPLRIETTGEPFKLKAYRQPLTKRQIVEDEIDKMLRAGVIRPSQSPFASPITLAPKKSGEIRFCVDYRKLNSMTIRDSYPIPNIQDIFDTLGGSAYFSTLDLRSGYWQLDLDEESIPKTAFTCHKGLYEFTRLPFGLKNAPGQFQRVMNAVLSRFISKSCLIYIDDVVVFSRSAEEHYKHVAEILDCINEAGLTLKLSKCSLGKESVDLLGYVVSGEGIRPQECKTEAIRNIPPPQNVKQVRQFLGMTGYYHQCIDSYAHISEPLVRLTKKKEPFIFGDEQQVAFDQLKQALCSNKIMAYPDPSKPYILYTDASGYAIGSILVQKDSQNVERVIQYVSKQLTEGQRKWSAIEREAYAVIFSLKKLQPYLQGADFVVYTDHKPLKSLFHCEIRNTRIQRWQAQLSEFSCTIEYRKGKNNIRADMLSRVPPPTPQSDIVCALHDVFDKGQFSEQREEFPEEWLEATTEESEDYIIEGGQLFSLAPPHKHALLHPRLMLPSKYRRDVVAEAHREVGHRSLFCTMRRVQNFCVWPGMRRDIREFILRCPHCQGNRSNEKPTPLEITDTPTAPFQKIGVDLTGPFIASSNGNKYLVTVIDHHSGWAEAYPIPDKRSVSIWKPLKAEFFSRFGFPNVMVTDQGTEFTSAEFREYIQSLNIDHRRSTPYHPQTNGCVERFNRSLKEILRKFVNNNSSEWESHLPEALLAYRMSESQSRNTSPYYALFGLEPNIDPINDNEYRMERMARARNLIYESQNNAKMYRHDRSSQRYQYRKKFKIGDYVTINAPEPVTLSHLRDHSLRVISIRGKVIGVQSVENPSNSVRYYNVDRLRSVPEEINWSEINPRQRRYRGPSDIRTLQNPIDDPEYEVISHDATRLTLRKKRRQPQGGDRSRFKRFRAGNRKRSRERERFSDSKRLRN